MPKIVVTSSDAPLSESALISTVLGIMVPVVPEAAQLQADLISTANRVESTWVEMTTTEALFKAKVAEEKKTGKGLRDGVFGLISFVELSWPEMVTQLPILSKFDVATSHVVADEMVKLTSSDPGLKKLGEGLRGAKERHVSLVGEIRRLAKRTDESKLTYRNAQLDLRNRINDARKFVNNASTPEADFTEMLKRPARNKPKNKGASAEEKKAEAANQVVPTVPPQQPQSQPVSQPVQPAEQQAR